MADAWREHDFADGCRRQRRSRLDAPCGDIERNSKPVHELLLLAALLAFDLAVGAHGVELLDDHRGGIAFADGLGDTGGRVFTARTERDPHPGGRHRLDPHLAAEQRAWLPAQVEAVDGHPVDTVFPAQFAQLQCAQQGAGDRAHLDPAAAQPGGERTQGLQPWLGPEHKGRGHPGQAQRQQQQHQQPAAHQRSAPRVRCTRHELPPSSMALARSSRTWPNGAFQRIPAPAPSFMVKSVKLFMALPAS